MAYTLKLRDVVIGRSELETLNAASRTARGAFRPGVGYELVEPIFELMRADSSATDGPGGTERYRRARDTLALALFARDGSLVETSRIDIVRDTGSRTGLSIEVDVVDDAFWTSVRNP